jgi:hypothetical protein
MEELGEEKKTYKRGWKNCKTSAKQQNSTD